MAKGDVKVKIELSDDAKAVIKTLRSVGDAIGTLGQMFDTDTTEGSEQNEALSEKLAEAHEQIRNLFSANENQARKIAALTAENQEMATRLENQCGEQRIDPTDGNAYVLRGLWVDIGGVSQVRINDIHGGHSCVVDVRDWTNWRKAE